MPAGGVRLDGGPVLSEGEASLIDTDASSIITISDRLVPSDTEDEERALHDKHKYRLPDVGKTRLHLRTKEPLSPSPRSPRRGGGGNMSGPTTPRSGRENGNGIGNGNGLGRPLSAHIASANGSSENVSDSDFVATGLSRAGSIYTLGRASLQGQLAHLTSLRLPDASSLAKRISSIPTSTEAANALSDASDQIRLWITKASDVLNGLSAEDDVEWAAAGGREGIEDVDAAISRFETLINVYVLSIEKLQTRQDIDALPAESLMDVVHQMETIVTSWSGIKVDLKGVKMQVEIAMEWEELWNSTLGQIAQEMEGLERLVFEMEERRHTGAEGILSSRDSIDISELETIVEERPGKITAANDKRLSIPPFSPTGPIEQPPAHAEKDDSSLLGLFARMQPLRASLDFLPMRLSAFHNRGNAVFPSACEDLASRREQLELKWKKLEYDAESLRRELGEDRWVLVFRNAGKQALKMCESVERSCVKLHEAVDASEWESNFASFGKKAESFEAKKFHYGPAIERVLAIIDRGVADRLTVNGEILRLQSDMRDRWATLQTEMSGLESTLESLNIAESAREKQLRDSVSTVMSSERASVASSMVDRLDTPGSSPASSVVGTSRKSSFHGSRTSTPLANGKTRKSSSGGLYSSIPKRIPLTQSGEFRNTPSPSPLALRATNSRTAPSSESPLSHRPRWTGGRTAENRDFLPLSALEPSKYAKTAVVKQTNFLRSTSHPVNLPAANRTPAQQRTRNVSTPSSMLATPSPARTAAAPSTLPRATSSLNTMRKSSLPVLALATPARPASVVGARNTGPKRTPSRQTAAPSQPLPVTDGNEADSESPAHHRNRSRPPSALATNAGGGVGGGRRSSMLPTRRAVSVPQKGGAAAATAGKGELPKWRP